MNMFCNMDHGALPAGLTQIQRDLSLDKLHVGNLGSIVFLGMGLGSWLTSLIIGRISYKLLLQINFTGNACGLLLFII